MYRNLLGESPSPIECSKPCKCFYYLVKHQPALLAITYTFCYWLDGGKPLCTEYSNPLCNPAVGLWYIFYHSAVMHRKDHKTYFQSVAGICRLEAKRYFFCGVLLSSNYSCTFQYFIFGHTLLHRVDTLADPGR